MVMLRTRLFAGAIACSLLVTACGGADENSSDGADEDKQAASETTTPTPGIATDAPPVDRILINDVVEAWPHVEVGSCEDFAPTHPEELVYVDGSPGACLEAAIAGDSAVVFSGFFDHPLPEDERADYEKWGEVAGHEVMVKVRGAEVSAGSFDFFTAWVPDTGEYAILAGRGAPGAWPYSRPTG